MVMFGTRVVCLITLVFVFVRMHVCVGMDVHNIAVAVLVGMSICVLLAAFLLVNHYLLLQILAFGTWGEAESPARPYDATTIIISPLIPQIEAS